MSKITIAVQCHNFQHRLSWMLASLREQIGNDLLSVMIAYTKNNGDPTTETVIDLYKRHLDIIPMPYDDVISRFQYRGYVRNDQLQACRTPWLLYADTDMVYSTSYFLYLLQHIRENNLDTFNGFISAGRMSMEKDDGNKLVQDNYKPTLGYTRLMTFPFAHIVTPSGKPVDLIERRNVGAGYFQLINVNHCPHEGYYVPEGRSNDSCWVHPDGKDTKGQKAKSDMQFRRRIVKQTQHYKLPIEFTWNQIHLNHDRDNEVGKHLEIQR